MRVLIVGNRGGTNIGGCFERAAQEMGLQTRILEMRLATDAPAWLRRFNWWFRGKRPTWLHWFSHEVLETCREWHPDQLVATGIAPIAGRALRDMAALGIRTVNYLTDDPWNPAHTAPWFLDSLPSYDRIFSLRRSNMEELSRLGCPRVSYLPFAYAPELHYPESCASEQERKRFSSDVAFVGSGDPDRVPYVAALIRAKFNVGLYGSFWERYPETRGYSRGQVDVRTLRLALGETKVALCLVRRANRDGNSMRTFEVPAIGACMLAEDTAEHRDIFGDDGKTVVYFRDIGDMLSKVRWLLLNEPDRKRLAAAAHALVTGGGNTYRDRLMAMLEPGMSSPGGRDEGLGTGAAWS